MKGCEQYFTTRPRSSNISALFSPTRQSATDFLPSIFLSCGFYSLEYAVLLHLLGSSAINFTSCRFMSLVNFSIFQSSPHTSVCPIYYNSTSTTDFPPEESEAPLQAFTQDLALHLRKTPVRCQPFCHSVGVWRKGHNYFIRASLIITQLSASSQDIVLVWTDRPTRTQQLHNTAQHRHMCHRFHTLVVCMARGKKRKRNTIDGQRLMESRGHYVQNWEKRE